MVKKIIVSANCLTGSLAAALKLLLLDNYQVIPIPLPAVGDSNAELAMSKELIDCNYWIASDRHHLATEPTTTVLKFKNIEFDCFHPDLTYAKHNNTGELTTFHANSRIAIWAYNNNIDIKVASKLFCKETYKELGYFDYFTYSQNALKKNILDCGFTESDFFEFYLSIKREGVFMHTINHPTSSVVVALAKLYAKKIDAKLSFSNRNIKIQDTLLGDVWPIYPEIGEEIGIRGCYFWRICGISIDGISNYLEFSFDSYSKQGISQGELQLLAPPPFSLNAPKEYDAIIKNIWRKL